MDFVSSVNTTEHCGIDMDKKVYSIVPEEIIRDAAYVCQDDADNSFVRMIKTGDEFRDAGLTPMYILDTEFMNLMCVAKETFEKKLH